MSSFKVAGFALVLCATLATGGGALAQGGAPPYAPGSVCLIEGGWCWAITSGQSGAPCQCKQGDVWVAGSYQ